MSDPLILKIAVPVPLPGLFDYLPPADVRPELLQPGCRLRLPFGRKHVVGVLVRLDSTSSLPRHKLKRAEALLDEAPVVDPVLMDLLLWAARYYQHPVGEVFEAALPRMLRLGRAAEENRQRWFATEAGLQQDPDALRRKAPRQAALLDALHSAAAGLEREQLSVTGGDWAGALKGLERKKFCEARTVAPIAHAPDVAAGETGPTLTPEQQVAVQAVNNALGKFGSFLLDGVTGSGKTEVYLRVIEQVLAAGQQALVLVPEIGLTPQLLSRFARRFPVSMSVLHSGLSDGDRLSAWRKATSGEARLIIGTRSAVFTRLQNPGLIVVDEEHDSSFKQQDGFRYSARDLALVRAQRHDIPVILGSATPSLESLHNAASGRFEKLLLPERPGSVCHPDVGLIDMRAHAARQGLSTPLITAIARHLEADGQVLLFLNRRGYAPALFCNACGWVAQCDRCDARLTVHRGSNRLRCHHCGHERNITEDCVQCHEKLALVGQGTERTEETLAALFPGVQLGRIDRDTTQRRGAMDKLLADVHSGQIRLLVGTQMLTKGHHFPGVTLVAILNADQGLFGSDFRSNERFAQTFVQVSGRAGRAERKGEVLVQTSYPAHPLLSQLIEHGYAGFADAALAERAEAQWPPFSRLALLRAEAAAKDLPLQYLEQARQAADELLRATAPGQVRVLGPAAAPMERRAGRYRAQLLLQSARRDSLHSVLAQWVPLLASLPLARRVRWSLDVDPVELF